MIRLPTQVRFSQAGSLDGPHVWARVSVVSMLRHDHLMRDHSAAARYYNDYKYKSLCHAAPIAARIVIAAAELDLRLSLKIQWRT